MRTCLLLAAGLFGLVGNVGVSHAAVLRYETVLGGAAEEPSNSSTGTGSAVLTVNSVARLFRLAVEFSDLVGVTTAAHVHGPTATPGSGTAGVMTQVPSFAGFSLGVTSGNYSVLYDMSLSGTWNPSFVSAQGSIAGAEAAFLASLASGSAYLNIHTSQYAGGEIRGFFTEVTPVPLPGGLVLSLGALAILGGVGVGRRVSA